MRLSTFRTQAILGFAIVIAVAVGALIAAIAAYRRADELRDRRLADYAEDVRVASELRFHAERVIAAGRGYLLTDDPALLAKAAGAEEQLDNAAKRLGRSSLSPAASAQLVTIRTSAAQYRHELEQLVEDAELTSDRSTMAEAVEARLLPRRADLDRQLNAFIVQIEQLLREEQLASRKASDDLLRLALSIGAAGAALAGILAWVATRRLNGLYGQEAAATARAEQAVKARDETLGVVAHDLRTPLGAMIMKSSLIQTTSTDAQTKKAARAIESIGMRMEFLIKTLLDAAKLEAGQFSLVPERCSVSEVFASTLDMFASPAAQRSVSLASTVEPLELDLWCDRERIVQVLMNLVGNALKFTPEGGRISLSALGAEGKVRFQVSDTGAGIAREHIEKIFDRYWKARDGDRRGTGLGLYITRSIVHAHGGTIAVTSIPGQGCTFTFELPNDEQARSTGALAPPALGQHQTSAHGMGLRQSWQKFSS